MSNPVSSSEKTTLHGWYSKTQEDQNSVIYRYKTLDGKIVSVTQISNNIPEITKKNTKFSDLVYMGVVTQFVEKFKLTSKKMIK